MKLEGISARTYINLDAVQYVEIGRTGHAVLHLTNASFEISADRWKEIKSSYINHMSRVKAIYFGADWCGQCKTLRPRFIEECAKLGIDHEELDADENSTIFEAYGIRNIPYIVVLENGTVRDKGLAAELIPKLSQHVLKDGNDEYEYGHGVSPCSGNI